MPSVNKVIIVGICGRDPELRHTTSGSVICNMSVATTYKGKDKDDTQWHRLVFFDRLAEVAGEYLKKGSPVYVEGSLKYGKYSNKEGVEQNTTDILVSNLQLLEKRGGGERGEAPSAPAPKPKSNRPPAPAPKPSGSNSFDDMDDDLPF